jgi:hypothetical protein
VNLVPGHRPRQSSGYCYAPQVPLHRTGLHSHLRLSSCRCFEREIKGGLLIYEVLYLTGHGVQVLLFGENICK